MRIHPLLHLIVPFALGAQSAPAAPSMPPPPSAPASAPAPASVRRLAGGSFTAPQPDPALFAELKRSGTRAVVNLRKPGEHDAAAEESAARAAGLLYFNIPVDGADPSDARVDEFLQLVARHERHGIFFHCASGNRAGAFWLIKRMLQDGWDETRAVAEAESMGLRPPLKAFALDFVKRHAAPASPASAPPSPAPAAP